MDTISILGITADCIIGDLPWEREQRQLIRCDVALGVDTRRAAHLDRLADTVNYVAVGTDAVRFLQMSRYEMLEALAEGLASMILEHFHPQQVTITLWKKAHFPGAEQVSVQITRPNS